MAKLMKTMDGNTAAAWTSYAFTEVAGIFPITARVDSRTNARPGDSIKFAFDVEKIHVFDKDTEQIITN